MPSKNLRNNELEFTPTFDTQLSKQVFEQDYIIFVENVIG